MMKHFFTISMILCVSALQAQIDKGNTLLGGTFGFGVVNAESSQTSSNSNLQPHIQFAYKQNRTIGFGVGLNYQQSKLSNFNQKNTHFSFAPSINFTQYHPLKDRFGWLLQEYAGASFNNQKNEVNNVTTKSSSTTLFGGIGTGVYYAAGEKKNWLLQANVGGIDFSYTNPGNGNSVKHWRAGVSLFQNFQFGFSYIFRK